MTSRESQSGVKEGAMARALRVIEQLEAKLKRYERAAEEPIAVVGIGCRMPGGATDKQRLWQLLQEGRDAVVEVPRSRWTRDPQELPEGLSAAARWAGLLQEPLEEFDAAFFGISPREAVCLDPQQRLSLEVAWEAFEDAGIDPHSLLGSRTGVFMGAFTTDFQSHLSHADSFSELGVYCVTGSGNAFTSGRLSYLLGLKGPSLTVDTACSSSLVAVHLARMHLLAGQCDMALAGGVNVILSPLTSNALAQTQALSPTGTCRPFDASANGFVRAEGCGVVVLKRLSDAVRDNNRIVATIRSSAVNQDGRSSGLTAPDVESQRALLVEAWRRAGLDPAAASYLEAHGTGTPLGDPIEFEAIRAVFGGPRARAGACHVGSIKANLGHLEAAAGIAGFIKAALVVHRRSAPPLANFRTANPRLRVEGTTLSFGKAAELEPSGEPLLAGVSAFGLSGTNAHVVLSGPPESNVAPVAARPVHVLAVSARSAGALARLSKGYADRLDALSDTDTYGFCRTALLGRAHHPFRRAVCGATKAELSQALRSFDGTEVSACAYAGTRHAASSPKVAWVFPGTGGQWAGMALKFAASDPVFRSALEQCREALACYADWDLMRVLEQPEGEALRHNHIVQPVLFSLQVAYAQLWTHYGLVPDVLIGHSMGEIAAAHVAGILALDDAARIVWVRAEVLKRVIGRGGMALVELTPEQLAQRVDGRSLSVAVHSSPRFSVVSGALPELTQLLEDLGRQGTFARRIQVEYASHCAQMDELSDELLARIGHVATQAARIPMHSTLLDRPLSGSECDARYWVENLRRPVRFVEAIKAVVGAGAESFLELGPHPVVVPAIEETLGAQGTVLCAERRELDAQQHHFQNLARLFVAGVPVTWSRVYGSPAPHVDLPTYAFERERFWIEPRTDREPHHGGLGRRVDSSLDPNTSIFQRSISAREKLLTEHRVHGCPVFPATGYLELAWSAAEQALSEPVRALSDVHLEHALALATNDARTLQIVVQQTGAGRARFVISTRASHGHGWTRHAHGSVEYGPRPSSEGAEPISVIAARCAVAADVEELYRRLGVLKLDYGPAFRRVLSLKIGSGEALATIQAAVERPELSAALLDGCLHALAGSWQGDAVLRVPVSVTRYVRHRPLHEVHYSHAKSSRSGADANGTVVLRSVTGQVVAEVSGLRLRDLVGSEQRPAYADWLYTLDWSSKELSAVERSKRPAQCLVVTRHEQDELLAQQLSDRLTAETIVVSHCRWSSAVEVEAVASSARVDHVIYVDTSSAGADAAPEAPCLALLPLAKGLAAARGRNSPRLWLVTRGVQAIAGQTAQVVAQAGLWGFARAIAIEHPELVVSCVDVDADTERSGAQLAAELLASEPETQLAYRNGARWVARLDHVTWSAQTSPRQAIRSDATYVISGGLGGLGLQLASWLVAQKAGAIVVTGRREPDAAEQVVLASLATAECEVEYRVCDVVDMAAVTRLIEELSAGPRPLAGVFHLAVQLRDGMLESQTEQHLQTAFAAKARGTLNLHLATSKLPLDLFVVYSSAAGLFGAPGQSNYAAASVYADHVIRHRRAVGLAGLSVQWGAFAEVGLASQEAVRGERLESRGSSSMQVADAHAALDWLLSTDEVCAGVIPLNLRQWLEFYPAAAGAPLLERLLAAPAQPSRDPSACQRLMDALRGLEARARPELLEAELRRQIATVLRTTPDRVDRAAPFQSLGLDSLMGLELRNRVEQLTGVQLSATLLWTYPSVAHLAEGLLERMDLGQALEPADVEPTSQPVQDDDVDALSLNELVSALNAELGAEA